MVLMEIVHTASHHQVAPKHLLPLVFPQLQAGPHKLVRRRLAAHRTRHLVLPVNKTIIDPQTRYCHTFSFLFVQ